MAELTLPSGMEWTPRGLHCTVCDQIYHVSSGGGTDCPFIANNAHTRLRAQRLYDQGVIRTWVKLALGLPLDGTEKD